MKKTLTILSAIGLPVTSYSQTQRLQLFEEFTGETCNPCAGVNPGLNIILNANTSKIAQPAIVQKISVIK